MGSEGALRRPRIGLRNWSEGSAKGGGSMDGVQHNLRVAQSEVRTLDTWHTIGGRGHLVNKLSSGLTSLPGAAPEQNKSELKPEYQ